MTALLDAPVGTLDVSRLEERQPDVPLTCTKGHFDEESDPCPSVAAWEGLCLGCGHVRRRCNAHYQGEVDTVRRSKRVPATGQTSVCYFCRVPWYIDQYVRIGA